MENNLNANHLAENANDVVNGAGLAPIEAQRKFAEHYVLTHYILGCGG